MTRLAAYGVIGVAAAWFTACHSHVLVSERDDEGEKTREASASVPEASVVRMVVDAGSPDGGTVYCGHTACRAVELGASFGTGAPCCYDKDVCGARVPGVCAQIHSPGRVDKACPSFNPYSGCCRPDGTCGIEAVGTAFGCVDPIVLFPAVTLGSCNYADE